MVFDGHGDAIVMRRAALTCRVLIAYRLRLSSRMRSENASAVSHSDLEIRTDKLTRLDRRWLGKSWRVARTLRAYKGGAGTWTTLMLRLRFRFREN
jgi:hypothetical protein